MRREERVLVPLRRLQLFVRAGDPHPLKVGRIDHLAIAGDQAALPPWRNKLLKQGGLINVPLADSLAEALPREHPYVIEHGVVSRAFASYALFRMVERQS
jgi:hypothetical protein